jgi:hypothetical protein
VLAAYDLLAVLRDDTPAVLDVARFPADDKNGTALLSAPGMHETACFLPGGMVTGFRWSGGT